MTNERVMAGLKLAVGADEDEEYTLEEALASIAREAGYRVVSLDTPAPSIFSGRQPMIYPAMIEAMREVGAVAKLGEYKESKDGPVQYRFRGVDAVVNAAGPAFRKVGVVPVPTLLVADRTPGTTARGGSKMTTVLRIRYDFFASDGSSVSATVEGEANDTSDKGTGKAFSVAYRIALLQILAIPTDDPDPDAVRIEGGHTPPLSDALTAFVLAGVRNDPIGRLEGLWHLVTSHVQPDARLPHEEDPRVWWEVFAERYIAEVDGAANKEELSALWGHLGQFGRTFRVGPRGDVGEMIQARVRQINADQKAAMEESATLIEQADDIPALDVATDVVKAHLAAHRITAEASMEYLAAIATKRDTLTAKALEADLAEQAEALANEAANDQGASDGDE
jgi:hypothetical protein